MTAERPGAGTVRWRELLLVVLVIGLAGILAELALLGHYEDNWQIVPIALIIVMLLLIGWYAIRPSRVGVRAIQSLSFLAGVSAAVGLYFHFVANVEWELETTPELHGLELFREVITGALPLLAPGAMLQLGLLGLLWAYRHPRLTDTTRI